MEFSSMEDFKNEFKLDSLNILCDIGFYDMEWTLVVAQPRREKTISCSVKAIDVLSEHDEIKNMIVKTAEILSDSLQHLRNHDVSRILNGGY